jgi:hypothetical protein
MRCWCEAWALWLGAALIDIIFFAQALTGNWLRVLVGVSGVCYDGIEMMRERSQLRYIS